MLVLSATEIAKDCLNNETGNGRPLSLCALCNDGSINACTLMLDNSHRAMNAHLKGNNWVCFRKPDSLIVFCNRVHQKFLILLLNSSENSKLFKIFTAGDLDHNLFLALKVLI